MSNLSVQETQPGHVPTPQQEPVGPKIVEIKDEKSIPKTETASTKSVVSPLVQYPNLYLWVRTFLIPNADEYKESALEKHVLAFASAVQLYWWKSGDEVNLNEFLFEYANKQGTVSPILDAGQEFETQEPVKRDSGVYFGTPELQFCTFMDLGILLVHDYIRPHGSGTRQHHQCYDEQYIQDMVMNRLNDPRWEDTMAQADARIDLRPPDAQSERQRVFDETMIMARHMRTQKCQNPPFVYKRRDQIKYWNMSGELDLDPEHLWWEACLRTRLYCRSVTRRRMRYYDPEGPNAVGSDADDCARSNDR